MQSDAFSLDWQYHPIPLSSLLPCVVNGYHILISQKGLTFQKPWIFSSLSSDMLCYISSEKQDNYRDITFLSVLYIKTTKSINFKTAHIVHLADNISLFTTKMHYLSKYTIVKLLPRHVSALMCHLQGAFYNRNVTVKKLEWLLWFFKVTWLSKSPEGGTGVLKHIGVEIIWFYFYSYSALFGE